MWKENLCLMATLACLGVEAIVSRPEAAEKNDPRDNEAAPSIDRDYVAGYDYERGGHGLGTHASYGFPESYDVGFEPHGHHVEGHHHHHHHHGHQKHHDYHKALAIKGLLVPLAGVALLGAAAAFVSNPILLQLGVISGSTLGRRKREAKESVISPVDRTRLNELKLLERFMAQIPKQEMEAQEKKMLANYLSCSGLTTTNLCLERLACELHSPEGVSMPVEANVLTLVVNEILSNDFIPEGTKTSVSKAVEKGKRNLGCEVYTCKELEDSTFTK